MNVDYFWNVRIVSDGSTNNIYCRNHSISVGNAISFDNQYDALTALEAFLGSLGCDLISGLQTRSRHMRLEIDNVEANLKCELENPLVCLDVVGEKGTPAIKRIEGTLYVSTFATPDEFEIAWQKTLELSPLYQTLKSSVQFEIQYKIV